jgi:hypothetical protein
MFDYGEGSAGVTPGQLEYNSKASHLNGVAMTGGIKSMDILFGRTPSRLTKQAKLRVLRLPHLLLYSSSVTFSIQSTVLPSSAS